MKENEGRTKLVATKLSTASADQLNRIAKSKGLTIYQLLQMVADTLIRYCDDQHNLSAEIEQAVSIFEHLQGWQNSICLADPGEEREVSEATYFISSKGKKGVRAVHVEKPYFGMWSETENVQKILERHFCLIFPERYRRLRLLATERECGSILELLDQLIDEHGKDSDVAALRQGFEDSSRSEWGQDTQVQKYKRHYHRTPDSPGLFNTNKDDGTQ